MRLTPGWRRSICLLAYGACLMGATACGGDSAAVEPTSTPTPMRIYHSPYQDVAWDTTLRIKSQHHDHVAARITSIQAYDRAGYQALSLMDYSGDPAKPYALKQRLWTPESVGITADVRSQLTNLQLFLPNAEEVGEDKYHITSPFLTTNIQKYTPVSSTDTQKAFEYTTPQSLIDLIGAYGGDAILAHPWDAPDSYMNLRRYRGIEIYSAFAEVMKRRGEPYFTTTDRSAALLTMWDRLLAFDQTILGIAVNDHFGPQAGSVDNDLRDSGKIIVFSPEMTLPAYRQAFEAGAFVAVADISVPKDQYPKLISVSITTTSIFLDTDGMVRWIANGREISRDSLLEFSKIPSGSTYVRAEISNTDGSRIFTQAFAVRPIGDADGDGVVNAQDTAVCNAVTAGTDTNRDHIAACAQ